MSEYQGCQLILAIDMSGSMDNLVSKKDHPRTGKKRIQLAYEFAKILLEVMLPVDPDGIDLLLFSHNVTAHKINSVDQLDYIWKNHRDRGDTNTHLVVDQIAQLHYQYRQAEGFVGTIAIVLTDGEPNSEILVGSTIVNIAQHVANDYELGISFVQVGDDAKARTFLKKMDDLKDELHLEYDIIDTQPLEKLMDGRLTVAELFHKALTS